MSEKGSGQKKSATDPRDRLEPLLTKDGNIFLTFGYFVYNFQDLLLLYYENIMNNY